MKYVAINSHVIKRNARTGSNHPPIRIARTKSDPKPAYAHEIEIIGPARLVYSPDKPIIRCGARLVLECADVRVTR